MKRNYVFGIGAILLLRFVLCSGLIAQNPTYEWTHVFGQELSDLGVSTASDHSGNVYVAGQINDTIDFDPGVGVYNLEGNYSTDVFIAKYDPSGNFIWARLINANATAWGGYIALDTFNNVYVGGLFYTQTDFDPGPGVFNITPVGSADIFICKLDSNGNFRWAKSMGGTSTDQCHSVAVDKYGTVYHTGFFQGTADFDPGPGTFNLTSAAYYDIYFSKLDSAGNLIWAKRIGSTGTDNGVTIDLGSGGDIYLSGEFSATVDFDPGSGVLNKTSNGAEDIYIAKFDTNGNLLWVKTIGGTGADFCWGMAVDPSDNVIGSGTFNGNVDFDPGSGTYMQNQLTAGGNYIVKLDPAGNFLWAGQIGGSGGSTTRGVACDNLGGIYIGGHFIGTSDIDPGPGNTPITATAVVDCYILKTDPSGVLAWYAAFGGMGTDNVWSISVNNNGNVITSGMFQNTPDFDPGSNTDYQSAYGTTYDLFIQKLDQCLGAAPAFPANAGTLLCTGGTTMQTVNAALNENQYWAWYTGSCGGTLVDTGSTVMLSPAVTTTYYIRGEGGCGTSTACATFTVTIDPCLEVDESAATAPALYPNPVSDQLFISGVPGIRQVAVYSITGQRLLFQQTSLQQIDVTSLAPGVYMLECISSSGVIRQKFIRE